MMLNETHLIYPDWPAPANVKALQTTRAGGISAAPYDYLNLSSHVGDLELNVAHNRQLLSRFVPTEPLWLSQVHGLEVVNAATASCQPQADAAYARTVNAVCVTMTADCLPVLFCDKAGTVVAAAHAGWRGLAEGVLEATINAMQVHPGDLLAWMGPAIGPQAFVVGDEVRDTFLTHDAEADNAFTAQPDGKWLANIYRLARQRLQKRGVELIFGGDLCTFSDVDRFFSFRRDSVTGRMASMIWLER
jgi:YfiH family protein